MSTYPVLLDLAGRRAVVVGGGRVAGRRLDGLLAGGADVMVVAPEISPAIAARPVRIERRAYRRGDLAGAWLVHACTDDPAVNARVAGDAAASRIFCVRADEAGGGSATTPAVARAADGVSVAVSGGGDPGRARAVRDAVALLLDTGRLPLRPHRSTGAPGSVAVVGGGPGDPGLITVRGRELLARADVVLVDRLAPRALLDDLDPDVKVIDVGKTGYRRGPTQEEINALLVDHARHGARVVRLKGGDPFVLGRGGEEMLACIEAGVPVEVVPGLSSALAVPASAGIPVTHRGVAASLAVVAAHAGADIDWPALASGPDTLVLLMGLRELAALADRLIAAGRSADTPAAVISAGTTPEEEVVTGVLGTIAGAAGHLRAPALVVVGDVVGLRPLLRRASAGGGR